MKNKVYLFTGFRIEMSVVKRNLGITNNKYIKFTNKNIFYLNLLLIGMFFILKLIDFMTSLSFMGYNGIYEVNTLAIPFLENPLLLFLCFSLFIFFILTLNIFFYIKKDYNEFLVFFLVFIVLLNLQGIWVLINNYEVFMSVI